MNIIELFLTSVGLAADAFSVATCRGLEARRFTWKNGLLTGLFFGVFQAVMPVIGFYLAEFFADEISAFDHWLAFALLGFLGAKMIFEGAREVHKKRLEKRSAAGGEENKPQNTEPVEGKPFRFRELITMSFATSIDALIVGVTFSAVGANIWISAAVIGAVTFALSLFGVFLGSKIGSKLGGFSEIAGGAILFLLGLKILLEHLCVISF